MGGSKHPKRRPQTRKQTKGKLTLRLIAEAMNANLGAAEVQEWLAGEICEIFGAQAGLLLLIKDDRNQLVARKHEGGAAWIYDLDLTQRKGLVAKCLQSKKPILCNQPSCEVDLELSGLILDLRISSFLCVPLLVNELTVGILAVINKRFSAFNSRDQEDLKLIGAAIAYAIYNARLIQQLRVANADLEISHWQLLHSRNTLRALFDSIPTSFYIIDRKYNLAAINLHRAQRIHQPPNTLVGRRCYEALYGREDVCPNCRVLETLLGGQNTTRTKRQWDSGDDPQEWEISTYPIQNEANQVIQAILLEQDVTEKRRLEATLVQSEKLAAVGQLAAGIAHEINNPLTAIIANAQLLQREMPAEDDKQELVDLIARAGARANQVVRNLLDLARNEQYDFGPTDVNETIRKALALLQHEFVARSVKLVLDLAQDLPSIVANQNHLQGVWLNLLSNALDAAENENGVIRVTTRKQGNEIRVLIADTGKGIPAEQLRRIFEPFYTTKAPGRGTGLGLSVCHRIIKQHGGHILVNSQIEIGTQFTVVLPIR